MPHQTVSNACTPQLRTYVQSHNGPQFHPGMWVSQPTLVLANTLQWSLSHPEHGGASHCRYK